MKRQPKPEPSPPSHLSALQASGFAVIRYLNQAIPVAEGHSEWLPSLCVGLGGSPDSYRVIEWLPKGHPANAYGFDGWQTSNGHSFGGVHQTIGNALGWFKWLEEQKVKRNG